MVAVTATTAGKSMNSTFDTESSFRLVIEQVGKKPMGSAAAGWVEARTRCHHERRVRSARGSRSCGPMVHPHGLGAALGCDVRQAWCRHAQHTGGGDQRTKNTLPDTASRTGAPRKPAARQRPFKVQSSRCSRRRKSGGAAFSKGRMKIGPRPLPAAPGPGRSTASIRAPAPRCL